MALLAVMLSGRVAVPVSPDVSPAAFKHIVQTVRPHIVIAPKEQLALVEPALHECENSRLQQIIELPDTIEAWAAATDFSKLVEDDPATFELRDDVKRLYDVDPQGSRIPLMAVLKHGSALGTVLLQLIPREKDQTAAILFTSGSTGFPKGAVYTEELMDPLAQGIITNVHPFVRLDFQRFDPVYAVTLLQTMAAGGQRAVGCGLEHLKQDILLSRPTHLGTTPVFWNQLYREFTAKVDAEHSPGMPTDEFNALEKAVGDEIFESLGGRIHVASCGGAAISSMVVDWALKHLGLMVSTAYGTRETGGIASDGIVYPGVDIHLLPVESLGYNPNSDPPRGEICVHSPRLILNYFNAETQTRAAFIDIEGKLYYRTGDIGETGKRGCKVTLKVIDRVSNYFKLNNGEWVGPEHIENVLEASPMIAQAYVMGSSEHPKPVVVVVPSPDAAGDMLTEIQYQCRHAHMRSHETPAAVHVESQLWSSEARTLTANGKKARAELKAKYDGVMRQLYDAANLGLFDDEVMLEGQVAAALEQMGFKNLNGALTASEAGCNSLAIAALRHKLQDLGLDLPMFAFYEYPLQHVEDMLALVGEGRGIGPVSHQAVSWGDQWQIGKCPKAAPANDLPDVLVSGVTGFLGPVLLQQILVSAWHYAADSRVSAWHCVADSRVSAWHCTADSRVSVWLA